MRVTRTFQAVIASVVLGAAVIVPVGTHYAGQSGQGSSVGGGVAAQRYISASGTDTGNCTSSGSPCLTMNYAASQATCGDSVSAATGTYAAQTITETQSNSCSAGTQVKFVCAGSPTTTPCIITSSATTTTIQASNLSFDGFTMNSTGVLQPKVILISASSATPISNITVKNSIAYTLTSGSTACTGGQGCTTGAVFIQGTSNVTFGPNFKLLACCSSDGFDIYHDGVHGIGNTGFTFANSTILGVFDGCARVHASAIPSQPSCTGYGIQDGCNSNNCEHDDGFAVSDCTSTCSWTNNFLFQAGSQPLFWQEFNSGVITGFNFIGNMVAGNGAPSSGGAGVNIGTIGTGGSAAYAGTFNFLYNTIIGVPLKVYTTDGGTDRWAVSSVVNLTGNLSEGDNAAYGGSGSFNFPGFQTVNSSGTNSGCSNNGSNLTLNYTYNFFYDVTCSGTGNVNVRTTTKAVVFGSIVSPYDLHLTTSTDPAVDQAAATCASASPDIDGNTRPAGAACDVGADEAG